jgi:hypothetical protein
MRRSTDDDLKAINAALFIIVNRWMDTHNDTLKHAAAYLFYTYLNREPPPPQQARGMT